MFKTDSYSNELMAFVLNCLFTGVIESCDIRKWSEKAILYENSPEFMIDLIDFDDKNFRILEIVGSGHHWNCTKDEDNALLGIAIKRDIRPYEMEITPQRALECLERNPHVEDAFRRIFDFIEF